VTGHLTRRQLEQLVADDPRAPVPPVLRVHIADCDRCSVRRLALEAARSRYLAARPPEEFAQKVAARAVASAPVSPVRRHPLQVIAPALGALALTAAVLLWLRPVGIPAAIHWKGAATLEVIARHAGSQHQLRDGDALAPGDQLAFAYALERPKHLLLLGVDDAGQITRYFGTNSPLAATSRAQLPVGIELDASRGNERLYAFFSDAVLDEAQVRSALLRVLASARTRGQGVAALREIDLPAVAAQRTLWFRKP
jgi:hypothetical protein